MMVGMSNFRVAIAGMGTFVQEKTFFPLHICSIDWHIITEVAWCMLQKRPEL